MFVCVWFCMCGCVCVCVVSMEITCIVGQGVFNGDKVLQRLGHFASCNRQVTSVQEVPDPVIILKVSLLDDRFK